jgi:hypothetical protein
MKAPVNVKLINPTESVDGWDEQAQQWLSINQDAGGNPDFYPLTIKGAYVIGVIHTICESVSVLLKNPNAKVTTYLPAYGVFASAIELLGRCINGNSTTRKTTEDLKTGFKWLGSSFFEDFKDDYEKFPDNVVLIQTTTYMYRVPHLVALRHLAAHGQATSGKTINGYYQFGYIDYEILAQFPSLLAKGLEDYWTKLRTDENLCNRLAKANIIALRKWPVFLSWSLFEADSSGNYLSIEEIFSKFNWNI